MLKLTLSLIISLFSFAYAFSSESQLSDLENIEFNFEEFFYYRDIKLPPKIQTEKKGDLAKKINLFEKYQKENSPKQDEILFDIISDYFELFDFNNAFKYTKFLENDGKISSNKEVVGKANLILGDIFNYLGMPEAAAYYYFLADKFLSNNKWYQACIYLRIGGVYWHLEDYATAENYIDAALDISSTDNFENLKIISLIYMAGVYAKTNRFDDSIAELKNAKSAISASLNKNWFNLILNITYGITYYEGGRFNEAVQFFETAVQESKKIGSLYYQSDAILYLAKICFAQNEFEKAIKYSNNSILVNEQNSAGGSINLFIDNYKLLSDIYSKIGNYDLAYKYLKEMNFYINKKGEQRRIFNLNLIDLRINEVRDQMLDVRLKYDDLTVTRLTERNKYYLYGITLAVFVIFIVIVLFFIRNRYVQKLNLLNKSLDQLVIDRTEALNSSVKSLEMEIEERKKLQVLMANVVEREQKRIAMDLHDNLGQILVGISFQSKFVYSKLKSFMDAKVEAVFSEILKNMQYASVIVRNMARLTSSIDLEREGLLSCIEKYCTYIRNSFGLACSLITPSKDESKQIEEYDLDWKMNVYRIIQEAVNNAVKHSRAKSITIFLDSKNLVIKDDGCGMAIDNNSDGIGLRIMKGRAELIKAKLIIASEINAGTSITCSFLKKG